MDIYHRRRLVSRIAFHVRRGRTWEEICALNERSKDRHQQEEMDACRAAGYQAVRNADMAQAEFERRAAAIQAARAAGQPPPVFPPLRLCDLDGCRFDRG